MKYLLILMLTAFVQSVFASSEGTLDTPCDTIKLVDGRIIVANVYFEDRYWVKFTPCNDAIKTKDQIEMHRVKEIVYASGNQDKPFVEDRSRLNRTGIYWVIALGAVLIGLLLAAIFLL